MAGVQITIVGTITDGENTKQCTIQGMASLSGLEIGGGPIIPPGQPPTIWPSPGVPTHPIVLPPVPPETPGIPSFPIYYPPEVGGGPIVPPEPPTEPGKPVVGWEAKVFWTEATGWGVVIVPKEGTL